MSASLCDPRATAATLRAKIMSSTPASKEEDGGGEGDAPAAKVQKLEGAKDSGGKAEEARPPWPWKKAKKAVIMMSFSGKDYLGMQR